MPHVLLVDDEAYQRQSLRKILESQGIKVDEAGSVASADQQYDLLTFDLVITELRLPGDPGSELIGLAHPVPVVVMTNYASLRSAVEAMKQGAVDYLAKPCAADDLLAVVHEALAQHPTVKNNKQIETDASENSYFEGTCPLLAKLYINVRKIAQTDSTVLILGEPGTGKELTARRVHESSPRASRRMVAVNCAAIPDTLIESELFGYEKGAFTGANTNRIGLIEAADGGTLFLDEIGELPLAAQARLLRFIQEGEIRRIGSVESASVNVRLICATHRNLVELENTDAFRRDLFHRINVLRLELPPLRERGNDIEGLTNWLLTRVAGRLGLEVKPLTSGAKQALTAYKWPGNVRELEHTLERALVMAESDVISGSDLNLPVTQTVTETDDSSPMLASYSDQDTTFAQNDEAGELSLEEYFQRFVLENQHAMNETELAQKLGISRKCLWERRQRFDLPRNRKKGAA